MKGALRFLVAQPARLGVIAVVLAASVTVGLFGAHDFALGLGVASTMAGIAVQIVLVTFSAGEAAGLLPRKDPRRCPAS